MHQHLLDKGLSHFRIKPQTQRLKSKDEPSQRIDPAGTAEACRSPAQVVETDTVRDLHPPDIVASRTESITSCPTPPRPCAAPRSSPP